MPHWQRKTILAQTRRRVCLSGWCFQSCRSILDGTDPLVQGRVSQGMPQSTPCCWGTSPAPGISKGKLCLSPFPTQWKSCSLHKCVSLQHGSRRSGSCPASEAAGTGSAANVCRRGARAGGPHLSDAQRGQRVSPINAN